MPTFDVRDTFWRDYKNLTRDEKAAFLVAVGKFVHDLKAGRLRAGLRIRALAGYRNFYEMTWAPDGRAIFELGLEVRPGQQHIIWRRVGTHDIFDAP